MKLRLKNLNYSSHIFCDVLVKFKTFDEVNNLENEEEINFEHISLCTTNYVTFHYVS